MFRTFLQTENTFSQWFKDETGMISVRTGVNEMVQQLHNMAGSRMLRIGCVDEMDKVCLVRLVWPLCGVGPKDFQGDALSYS